jgi:hypothetical protein
MQANRMMVRIYEVWPWKWTAWHDLYTKFHKHWPCNSKMNRKEHMGTNMKTARLQIKAILFPSKSGKCAKIIHN